MAAFYMRVQHSTYHAYTSYYMRIHAWCDATRVVVLALYVCHAYLVRVACV